MLNQQAQGKDDVVQSAAVVSVAPLERRFAVRFSGARSTVSPRHNISFSGKGEVIVTADSVTVSGKRQSLFRLGKPERYTFSFNGVCNVRVNDRRVQFNAPGPDAKIWHTIHFLAANADEACALAAMLPTHYTEAFAKAYAELNDFEKRLDALSPSSPITYGLVGLNVLVFLLMACNGAGFFVANPEVALRWGSNFGPMTTGGQWWRLLTSMFIHFGLLHLAFNMLGLYSAGRLVERMYGSLHFLILYLFAGLAGSTVSLLWHPSINSAGASGAIFGVFGGLLVFMMNKKNAVPSTIMNAHSQSAMMFIGYNLFYGFVHSGIDNGAHIGGLLGGIVMGYLLARPLDANARAQLFSKRLGLSCVAAVSLLALVAFPLYHPSETARNEAHFYAALVAMQSRETQAINDFETWRKKAAANPANPTGQVAELENNITPQWQTIYDSIAVPVLPDTSKYAKMQQVLTRYLDDRVRFCKLLAQGIRNNDKDSVARALQASEDAKRAGQLFKSLPKPQ